MSIAASMILLFVHKNNYIDCCCKIHIPLLYELFYHRMYKAMGTLMKAISDHVQYL